MSAFSTLVLVLVVAIAAVAGACSDSDPPVGSSPALGRGVYVESAWKTARAVSGHSKHVVGEKIACVQCHELTNDSIGSVLPGRCASCHEKESRIEHAAAAARERFGPSAKTDCTACHAFSLAAPEKGLAAAHAAGAGDCSRCHSSPQGETPAVTVHGSSDCLSCHRPHDDGRPKSAPCSECHEGISTTHASRGKSKTETCTTCHTHQHAPASAATATCKECHSEHEPKVPPTALFANGHSECVGCHQPHAFEGAEALACRSCHEGVRVLAAPRVPEHSRCTSCHAPHDVRGSAEKACAGCHSAIHPDHPKSGRGGACVGCHEPHPGGHDAKSGAVHAFASARDCGSCHETAVAKVEFHAGVACQNCHVPHAFVLETSNRAVCSTCHAQQLADAGGLPGHASCEGCHGGLPHGPLQMQAGCESCHAATQAHASAGHQQCTSCHEPHGGKLVADCKSCHATEHATAPVGHQTCSNCHDQHSGATSGAACSNCHAAEAHSAHGELGKDCSGCHRPHGPQGVAKAPGCTTCHSSATLSGLHRVSEHATCTQCHSGHDEPSRAMRSDCMNCHKDRTNHFPTAPSCTSCHLFGATR